MKKDDTAEDLMELAYRQDRRAVPPGHFLYSNTGYLLLADVLRHVHGTAIAEIANQVLFTPLGMASARFKSDPREVIGDAATSYSPTATGWIHHQRPVTLPGPGSLWCTATDLNRWLGHLSHEWHRTTGTALPFDEHVGYRPSDHQPFTYGADLHATDTAVFHHGHEQGFSAAARLSRSGLTVVCLSNHAAIPADRVTASALTELARHPDADPHRLLTQAARSGPEPKATTVHGSDLADTPHTELGTYSCPQVPGTVRLSRSGYTLYLWHRGTHDRLTRTDTARYATSDYTLTFPADTLDDDAGLDEFILDLNRAPHLLYQRRPNNPAPSPPATTSAERPRTR